MLAALNLRHKPWPDRAPCDFAGDTDTEIQRLAGEVADALRARGVAESQLLVERRTTAGTASQLELLRVRYSLMNTYVYIRFYTHVYQFESGIVQMCPTIDWSVHSGVRRVDLQRLPEGWTTFRGLITPGGCPWGAACATHLRPWALSEAELRS